LTQIQIAGLCGIKQYTVSRNLNQYKKALLKALKEFSQPEGWVSEYVGEWLHKYFSSPDRRDIIQAALVEALKQLTVSERELLSLRYGERLDFRAIGLRLGCSADEVKAKLCSIEAQLHIFLLTCLEKWMKDYVKHWLHIFYQAPIQQTLIHDIMALPSSLQNSLQLHYKNSVNLEQIEWGLEWEKPEMFNLFWEGKCQLEEGLIQWTTDILDISLTGNQERQKINQIVENWLKNFYIFGEGGQEDDI
jgi:hypothetical protein